MKKLLIVLACAGIGSLSAMEPEKGPFITLQTQGGTNIQISHETAKKIPLINDLMDIYPNQYQIIPLEKINSETLRLIIGTIRKVYNNAPILQVDKDFFKQTLILGTNKIRPAYTPLDIPEQVRNIVKSQLRAAKTSESEFIYAAGFLQLDWITSAMEGGISVADMIAYSKLPQIENNTLKLTDKNIVSLAGISLLDQDIINNLQQLFASKNNIETIPNELSNLVNLKYISLNFNKIRTISTNAFQKLEQLERIDLHDNLLTTIPNNKYNKNLQTLNLGKNQITTIPNEAFNGLTKLISLNLSDNRINNIDPYAFKGLHNSLQILDLSGNKIKKFGPTVYNLKLKRLNVRGNPISKQDLEALRSLLRRKNPNTVIVF